MNHPYLTRTLIAAGALLMGTSASAIQIDTFLDDPSQIVASESAGGVPTGSSIATPHALGDARSIFASGGTGDFGTLGIIGDGQLRFANTPDSAGSLSVEYTFQGDITDSGESTGFLFTIAFADALVDYEIEVLDTDISLDTVSGTFPTGITGSGDEQDVYIPFSALTGDGADLTDLLRVSLILTPNNGVLGADLSISDFRTGVVPEPSSLALIALGGLAMTRRRRTA